MENTSDTLVRRIHPTLAVHIASSPKYQVNTYITQKLKNRPSKQEPYSNSHKNQKLTLSTHTHFIIELHDYTSTSAKDTLQIQFRHNQYPRPIPDPRENNERDWNSRLDQASNQSMHREFINHHHVWETEKRRKCRFWNKPDEVELAQEGEDII